MKIAIKLKYVLMSLFTGVILVSFTNCGSYIKTAIYQTALDLS
jgi:hypothetical protein